MAGSVRLVTRASAVHVRTARLVAVTIARRAGLDEDVVGAVRPGAGEACAAVCTGTPETRPFRHFSTARPSRTPGPADTVRRQRPLAARARRLRRTCSGGCPPPEGGRMRGVVAAAEGATIQGTDLTYVV